MKTTNHKPLIRLNLAFIVFMSLLQIAKVDFSEDQNMLLGILFALTGLVVIVMSIFVFFTYVRNVINIKEWTKNDYYVILLTLSSLVLFLIVGNYR
jgi:glucose-6-phosphate-specific signal transduction histidine kinase